VNEGALANSVYSEVHSAPGSGKRSGIDRRTEAACLTKKTSEEPASRTPNPAPGYRTVPKHKERDKAVSPCPHSVLHSGKL
jgi:hypothetical protein